MGNGMQMGRAPHTGEVHATPNIIDQACGVHRWGQRDSPEPFGLDFAIKLVDPLVSRSDATT